MELLERESALGALERALEDAGLGQGSVVLVSGEPGIGKSALVRQFARWSCDRARVLTGWCDDLISPRALSALRDLADDVSPPLRGALRGSTPPELLHSLLVRELRSESRPTVLVIEDVHWADQASLDALTVIGRRVADLPAVIVLTFRPGELEPAHPLLVTVESLRQVTTAHLQLAPLSRRAVRRLAGDAAPRVFAATGGNPLLVTEMLGEDGPLPPSLATLVLGRAARLPEASRQLLELVSVVPSRVSTEVLDLAHPGWAEAAVAAERRQLISSDPRHVWFRHELTRQAVRSGLPPVLRRLLHGRVLTALQELDADPADLVHHAEQTGDDEVVGTYARRAAHQARAVEANREAFAHLRRAAAFTDRLDLRERARLWEELADSAYLIGRTDEALQAADRSVAAHRGAGQVHAAARCLDSRAHLHWVVGDGAKAWGDAREAVRMLGPDAPETTRARSWLRLAELAMLASRPRESLRWGARALRLAHEDHEVRARALVTLGAMRLQLDPDDPEMLEHALECCRMARLHHHELLVRIAYGFVNLQWVRPEDALRHVEGGRAEARAHEIDTVARYLDGLGAWLHLRAGRTGRAAELARQVGSQGQGPGTVADLQARTVLAELALRHSTDDVDDLLSQLADDVDRTGELKRIQPVLELQVERALLENRPLPTERVAQVRRIVGTEPLRAGGVGARFAAWAVLCGAPEPFTARAPPPHAAMLAQDWRGAADAFGAVEWWYDRALMLSLDGSAQALREALELARSQDAARLAARVSRQLQESGLPVPRGPMPSTRANPAGLTDRQAEVLLLVRDGLKNADIAARLHISPRTVEHHVSSILTKLGVSTRAEAVARCVDLGVHPEGSSTREPQGSPGQK